MQRARERARKKTQACKLKIARSSAMPMLFLETISLAATIKIRAKHDGMRWMGEIYFMPQCQDTRQRQITRSGGPALAFMLLMTANIFWASRGGLAPDGTARVARQQAAVPVTQEPDVTHAPACHVNAQHPSAGQSPATSHQSPVIRHQSLDTRLPAAFHGITWLCAASSPRQLWHTAALLTRSSLAAGGGHRRQHHTRRAWPLMPRAPASMLTTPHSHHPSYTRGKPAPPTTLGWATCTMTRCWHSSNYEHSRCAHAVYIRAPNHQARKRGKAPVMLSESVRVDGKQASASAHQSRHEHQQGRSGLMCVGKGLQQAERAETGQETG